MKSAASDKGGAWSPTGALTLGLLSLLFAIASARAQSFTVEWFTFDNGGSVSTGGVYSASVSIGQPVSGDLTGGSFSASSDFWTVAGTIQRLNAPQLLVTNAAGVITLSWEKLASDFVLDSAPTLNGPAIPWTQVAFPYQTNATHVLVTHPMLSGSRFYRLRKP